MKILEARGGARRLRTGAALAATAVAASVLTLAGPVSSASAAGSCHGGGCTNRDPQATGCASDAYTVKTVSNLPDFDKGDLRYSPSCDAAWIRVVSWSTSVPISGSVYGEASVNGTWVPFWAENAPEVAGGTSWSPMVGGYPHYDIRVEG
ncbi:DUF2690 domain-containing protein [Streptomyces sp. NPDC002513]